MFTLFNYHQAAVHHVRRPGRPIVEENQQHRELRRTHVHVLLPTGV